MLVDDHLLPGAGPGADLAGQFRLSARLHGRDDVEGSEARARCRAPDARRDTAGRGCCRGLPTLRRGQRRYHGFFRYHSLPARGVTDRAAVAMNLTAAELWRSAR